MFGEMNTLFDKIWDAHVVHDTGAGPVQLYIDRLYCHEVTSPQAFEGLRQRGIGCLRPDKIFCMPDHNTPTHDQDKPIEDPVSRKQVETLAANARQFGLEHFGMMDPRNGVIHVVGPEQGLSLPGMTIVCGDSHTSTHGAMGAVAFGIGTSEVEMVLASQCILQQKPKSMRIRIEGTLGKGVTAKDIALYLMQQLTTSGATGYFVEYAGSTVRSLSMEGRLTLCNLSIEMGARGGFIAPDEVTFAYLKGKPYAPKGAAWDQAVAQWKTLRSDDDAVFDREEVYDAAAIPPMITYGTNPGMGMAIDGAIPADAPAKALNYMDFRAGESLLGRRGKPAGKTRRLRLPGRLHEWACGRFPGLRFGGERPQESYQHHRLAGSGFLDGLSPDPGRGTGPRARRRRIRTPATGLFGLPGHERRQDSRREI